MEKEIKQNKTKKYVGIILFSIIFSILIYFRIERDLLLSGITGIISIIILFLFEFLDILQFKTKEEREIEENEKKLEEDRLKLFEKELEIKDRRELNKLYEKKEKEFDLIKESINKLEKNTINDYVYQFLEFGFIMFFVFILFFGSLDGKYGSYSQFSESMNNISEIGMKGISYGFEKVFDSLSYLFLKLYELGATDKVFGIQIKLFFWLYWICLFYWIGYLYIYKILLEGSYKTIKEIFIPMFKNIIKKWKEKKT